MKKFIQQSFFDEIIAAQPKLKTNEPKQVDHEVKTLVEWVTNEIIMNKSKKVILFNIPLEFPRDARRTVLSDIVNGFKVTADVYACKYGVDWEHNFTYKIVRPNFNEYPKIWARDTTDASLFGIEFRSSNRVLKGDEGLSDLNNITPYV